MLASAAGQGANMISFSSKSSHITNTCMVILERISCNNDAIQDTPILAQLVHVFSDKIMLTTLY